MIQKQEIYIDPQVCRKKFECEVNQFYERKDDYQKRGWWLMEANYPSIFVIFAASHTRPPIVAFGVEIDFTDYDLVPPSVTLVNPFTRVPYTSTELPTQFPRKRPPIMVQVINQDSQVVTIPIQQPPQNLIVHSDVSNPFICLPGIREYHQHPSHSDDNWLLHRVTGNGKLYSILNSLYRFGVTSMGIQIQNGTNFGIIPNRISE